jgi:hypothetical protein
VNVKELIEDWGPVTVVLLAIVVFTAIVGGVVVIVKPTTLSFSEYLSKLQTFAGALAALGIGRGLMNGAQAKADATVTAAKVEAGVAHSAAAAERPKAARGHV